MAPEVSIIPNVESVADFKAGLANWKPKTDEEAAKFLALRSIIGNKAGDAARDAANARLIKKCDKCDVLEFDGFKLKPVFKKKGAPKTSEKLEKMKAKYAQMLEELENQKIRINGEQEILGYEDVPEGEKGEFSHFLVQ